MTQFRALEFTVFVDGGLHERQLFHGERLPRYEPALAAQCEQFREGGWSDEPTSDQPNG